MNIWEVSPQISTPEEVKKIVKKLRKLDVSKMEDHVLELPVQIKSAFEKCNSELLRPVFDELEEKYDYEVLRLVRTYFNAKIDP